MPNRFYSVERPRNENKLPKVISKEDVFSLIAATKNIKHSPRRLSNQRGKCIISLLYSTGIRISELLNMELQHIDSKRNRVFIPNSKGGKDRYTIISNKVIELLRIYYKKEKPTKFLFEGPNKSQYTPTSVRKIINKSCSISGIKKKVSPHTFRHSFATHLMDNGTDLRYIQVLLGHNSSKTTEQYTYVSNKSFDKIKNPLDNLF